MWFILFSFFRGTVDSFSGCRIILDFHALLDAVKHRGVTDATERNLRSQLKPVNRSDITRLLICRVFQCVFLNGGVFGLSVLAWYTVLLPLLQRLSSSETSWSYVAPILQSLFSALWVIPLFFISRVVNFLWFQDIADWTFYQKHGRNPKVQSLSKLIADTLFSLCIQALFLIQEALIRCLPLPVVPTIFGTVHLCFLYSLYAFEYKWFSDGWALHYRLQFVEAHWPYFLGFGLPLALLTTWPESFIIRGCVFYVAFPLQIISGHLAKPIRSPTGFMPLRLFSPVVRISDYLIHRTVERQAVRRAR